MSNRNDSPEQKFRTSGGHSVTQDDTAKKITVQSAGGQSHILDDNAKTITQTTGTVKHIVDGNNNVISSVATSVGDTSFGYGVFVGFMLGMIPVIIAWATGLWIGGHHGHF